MAENPTKRRRWTEAVVISLAFAIGFNYWWTAKLNRDAQAGGLPSIEGEQIASFAGPLQNGAVGAFISPPKFNSYPWDAKSAASWEQGGSSASTNSTGRWAA